MRPTLLPLVRLMAASVALACLPAWAQQAPVPSGQVAQQTGLVVGRVIDALTGARVIGALVTVEEHGLTGTTDQNGDYRIGNVPIGLVRIRLEKQGYQGTIFQEVAITPDEPAVVDVALEPGFGDLSAGSGATADGDVIRLDEFVVRAAPTVRNSAEAFLPIRQNAVAPVNTLSAREFASFPVSDALDALSRIPGVSQSTQGSFAVIRGLNERYNVATLNRVQLPSADPERQSVELDLFPTRFLDGLVVYKAFSPDLPGTASGGGVELVTTSFPTRTRTTFSVGTAFEDGTLNNDGYLTYRTIGNHDLYAAGAQDRLTPFDDVSVSRSDIALVPVRAHMRPGTRLAFAHGSTLDLGEERQLGYSLNVGYDVTYSSTSGEVRPGDRFRVEPSTGLTAPFASTLRDGSTAVLPRLSYEFEEGNQEVKIGLLGTLAYRFNSRHQLQAIGFFSQIGDDTARVHDAWVNAEGSTWATPEAISLGVISEADASPTVLEEFDEYLLRYRERNLTSLALDGRHTFDLWDGLTVEWVGARNTTYQDEPDTRRSRFGRVLREAAWIPIDPGAAESAIYRQWSLVEEEQLVGNVDVTQRFGFGDWYGWVFKAGGNRSETDRFYSEALAASSGQRLVGPTTLYERPEDAELRFQSSIINRGEINLRRVVSAGYGMLTIPVLRQVKLTGGLRMERTELSALGFGALPGSPNLSALYFYIARESVAAYFDRVAGLPPGSLTVTDIPRSEAAAQPRIRRTDALPAISITYTPTDRLTFRANYAQTIAKPSLREVGNYVTTDTSGEYSMGNAFLRLSDVRNWDVRAEYFFDGGDLLAVSGFYKEVDNPIEKRGGLPFPNSNEITYSTWVNNPNTAYIAGVELEFRKNLGFLADALDEVSLGGNATWVEASIRHGNFPGLGGDFQEKPVGYPTETRRLFDQPAWLANGDIQWQPERWGSTFTLSVTASDRVLTQVNMEDRGELRFLDEYLDRVVQVDFVWQQKLTDTFTLRATARNLLDPERRLIGDPKFTAVPVVNRRWRDGRSYSVSVSASF